MQKIIPFLWFDDKAEEAVKLYTSLFKNSKIGKIAKYGEEGAKVSGRPKGSVMTVEFNLHGQEFVALNGGPYFKFTPAISFFVNCATEKEIDELWNKLSKDGSILMPFQKYPFSEKYGWLKDKYGVSWQLSLADHEQKIIPSLLFVGKQNGNAEKAINFYTSLFKNSKVITIAHYAPGEPVEEGNVKYSLFSLNGQEFIAMDGGLKHAFTFTEATSFIINCETQQEVDNFWNKLSEGGEKSQCGWLKDKYDVSWQVVPTILNEMLTDKDPKKAKRVMEAMLKMHKIDIKTLKEAYDQK